jgi:predicted transcriptional regulator
MIEKTIQYIDTLLKKANYETLVFDKQAKFCFDLLVKKENSILLVKIFPNIDNLNKDVIEGIKTLSSLLKSKPVLIGIKNRYQSLENNTIYLRLDLPFISLKTFENMLSLNMFPYVLARRGGGVIYLDGKLMKTLREQKSISRKDLAIELGVTKRTVCAYENESMRPSDKIALKILDLLENESIFKKINFLEWNIKFSIDQAEIFEKDNLNPFESHLQDVIEDIGIASLWYKKGQVPFNLSMYSRGENIEGKYQYFPIFSGVSEEKTRLNEFNVEVLKAFSKILEKYALFIVNNEFKVPNTLQNILPVIKIRTLEEIDNETEFVELVKGKEE